MATNEDRIKFFQDISDLISILKAEKIEMMPTCFFRTQSEQQILYSQGKSQTLDSQHTKWLAIDLVLVRFGQLIWRTDKDYDRAGQVWESLGHTWGGRWESLQDIYHFEF